MSNGYTLKTLVDIIPGSLLTDRQTMPLTQTTRDEKQNLVVVTLFETHLAKFILEHAEVYQTVYFKLIDSIMALTKESPTQNATLRAFFRNKPEGYDLPRYLYTVFSRVNESYPGHDSFESLKSNFNILASDYFLKIIADELLNAKLAESPLPPSPSLGFFPPQSPGKRSPYDPARCATLFLPENRGVLPIEEDEDDAVELSTQDIGIVSIDCVPDTFKHYFEKAVYPARFNYNPDENSFVGQWLRERHLPIIAGASGSTDLLFSRLLPLAHLSPAEVQLLIVAQACSLIASGHHSFFETLLVADHFGHTLRDTDTLIDYYLQCFPATVRQSPTFIAFLDSEPVKNLLTDMPLFDLSHDMSPTAQFFGALARPRTAPY